MNMASRYDGMIYPENIQSFLEDIALITDADTSNANILDKVSLMTIHLSKGLEYPCVAIVGVEEGIFPHSRTLTDAPAVEEERRLMYVAMTRAKQELYISRALERYTYGNYSANPKSRFIKEIPEEYIEKSENMASREQAIF
jgi:DNA helicase-2/ATP-dependent DNA helicase PcrA